MRNVSVNAGIGKVSAAAIKEWCTNSSHVQLVKRIEEADFAPTTKNPEIENFKRVDASSIPPQETQKISKKRTQKIGKGTEAESEGVLDASSNDTLGVNIMEATEISTLQGKNVVITGEFENFSRKELEQLVQKNGGQVRKSVCVVSCSQPPRAFKLFESLGSNYWSWASHVYLAGPSKRQ